MAKEYVYTDKFGNPVAVFVKHQATVCPSCGGKKIKDKGSFSKCMACGERIMDSGQIDIAGKN